MHIQISLGTKFQRKLRLFIISTNFVQKWYFQSKTKKVYKFAQKTYFRWKTETRVNITMEFCIFELF